jgi:tetratricopeptide (TPR) repeat protein
MTWSLIVPPIIAVAAIAVLVRFVRNKRRSGMISRDTSESRIGEVLSSKTGGVIDGVERWVMAILSKCLNFGKVGISICARKTLAMKRKVAPFRKTMISKENWSIFKKVSPPKAIMTDGITRADSPSSKKSHQDERRTKSDDEYPKPALQEKVATPRKKVPLKDAYEETLIERITLNPRDVSAYESLGDFYLNQKNFEDAQECYRQILKLNPLHRGAKVRLHRLERILAHR